MTSTIELSSLQEQAYELIKSHDGVTQSELWKELDADSRAGSRLAKALEEKGLIERKETIQDGQTTYLLTPVENGGNLNIVTTNELEERADGELSSREKRALDLIREENGVYQSEFWKELDISSRTGSRIASSLEEKDLIQREEAVYGGRRTYSLLPVKEDLDFSLLMAGDAISPFIGEDNIDPIESEAFTDWLLKLSQEE